MNNYILQLYEPSVAEGFTSNTYTFEITKYEFGNFNVKQRALRDILTLMPLC